MSRSGVSYSEFYVKMYEYDVGVRYDVFPYKYRYYYSAYANHSIGLVYVFRRENCVDSNKMIAIGATGCADFRVEALFLRGESLDVLRCKMRLNEYDKEIMFDEIKKFK